MVRQTLYIISGANGSGKTTFAQHFTQQYGFPFINADEIAKELNPHRVDLVNISAGKLFFKELSVRLMQQKSFAIESTLSGQYLVKIIKTAKSMQYHVHLIFLFLDDPKVNIDRVKTRVLAGGHNIPTADIIRRFYRSSFLFWTLYRSLCDSWLLVYNSDERFEEVAHGDATSHLITDQILFDHFIKGVPHVT